VSRWFRHYAGMMRDDKLVRVAIRSKQTIERVTWIWGAILESAAEIDEDGRYDLDAAEIAYFLRADECDVDSVLSALSDAGRVVDSCVVKWGNRQFQSDRSKERVAAHRERKRSQGSDSNRISKAGNGAVTLQAGDGNAPETELETETEVSEAKASSHQPRPWALPLGVSLQVWTDLMTNRKKKRLPNTPTAWAKFQSDLAEMSALTGIPPPKIIEMCTAKGWGAIYDPRNERDERPNTMGRHQPNDGLSSTARAAIAVFGR
jgi:hypothetical protein